MKRERIPDPENYFNGVNQAGRVICRNVLLFERLTKAALQQKHLTNRKFRADRMHHRYMLIRVFKTSGVVNIVGRNLTLNEGDLLLMTPYQFHHYMSLKSEEIDWLFITFELAQGAEQLEGLSYCVIRDNVSARQYCDGIVSFWQSVDSAARYEVLPMLDRLLMHLVRSAQLVDEGEGGIAGQVKSEAIVGIEGLVLRSVREGWSLEEVARRAKMSDRHLRTCFRAEVGISLSNYRANYQLHLALSLMRNDELSLSDVAELSGFNSQPSFTRFIKRMTGLTPRDLRLSQQSEPVESE